MGIVYFVVFALGIGIGALLFGADSRDTRSPTERVGSWAPLR